MEVWAWRTARVQVFRRCSVCCGGRCWGSALAVVWVCGVVMWQWLMVLVYVLVWVGEWCGMDGEVVVWVEAVVVVVVVASVVGVCASVVWWWVVWAYDLAGSVLVVDSSVACPVALRESLVVRCWCWSGVWHEFWLE
jgi:hypothetical protein